MGTATAPIVTDLTTEEWSALERHATLIESVFSEMENKGQMVEKERAALREALDAVQAERRKIATGIDDPRQTVWNQDESRRKKAALYKLYIQSVTLGEVTDKIAKRFISGKWSIIPRPSLGGVKKKKGKKPKGKVGELLLLLDFLYNVNDDENFNQLLYKFIQDMILFGESYIELAYRNNIPANMYSLPTPNMEYVADKFNVVKSYTFGSIESSILLKQKKIKPEYVFRTWVPSLLNPLRGFSVVEGMVNPVFSDQMMIRSQQSTFQNLYSSAPVVYEMKENSTSSMAKSFTTWLRENSWGVNNSGNERVLYGGVQAKALALKPLEAEFLDGREVNKKEIKGRMHVPDDFTDETSERNFRFDVLDFYKELFLEAFNYAIIQRRFKIQDWVLDISFADYAADPYAERVKTLGEKRKEQQLEEETKYDGEPLIVFETHAQDQNQTAGKASKTPGSDDPVARSKRGSRTAPGKGKDKKGASKPPAPPDKDK